MLVEFSVSNFRSIKEQQTLSMLPSSSKRRTEENAHAFILPENHKDLELLKTAVIYGANASGKSNLLKGLHVLGHLVVRSSEFKLDELLKDEINYFTPFKLDAGFIQQNTRFEIDFIAEDDIRYEYIVEVNEKEIKYESLHFYKYGKRISKIKLYSRKKGEKIQFSQNLKGNKKIIESQLLDNQLFLSVGANENNEQLKAPYLFFKKQLDIFVFHDTDYDNLLIKLFTRFIAENENDKIKLYLEDIIRRADTSILGLKVKENTPDSFQLPAEIPDEIQEKIIQNYQYSIQTRHRSFRNEEEIETYLTLEEESTGTSKLFAMGSIILQTLAKAGTLIVDELDKSLHPELTEMLINLFHNTDTNPKNAQLIFATHDTNLLKQELFTTDQVWMVSKDYYGASNIYSLTDIKKLRKNQNVPWEKWYLSGRFGAKPVIDYSPLKFDFSDYEQTT